MTYVRHRERSCVFGTGLIALDLVMSADPNVAVQAWAGGTCGNVLTILAYLGWDAFPVARMNGDSASQRVLADMRLWGVRLDYATCAPTANTPMIIQEIRKNPEGVPSHRFSLSCPRCGNWLPSFRPVTLRTLDLIASELKRAHIFFMDRLSPAILVMASQAAAHGALIVFEPSGRQDEKLLAKALTIVHVIKYADQRFKSIDGVSNVDSAIMLEIQTLGADGLRFRRRASGRLTAWKHLDAVVAPGLVDSCGSGDWCTAGFLAKSAEHGLAGFRTMTLGKISDALQYGQALAAWNCGYEGARGGMYSVSRTALQTQINALLSGHPTRQLSKQTSVSRETPPVACPRCPQATS